VTRAGVADRISGAGAAICSASPGGRGFGASCDAGAASAAFPWLWATDSAALVLWGLFPKSSSIIPYPSAISASVKRGVAEGRGGGVDVADGADEEVPCSAGAPSWPPAMPPPLAAGRVRNLATVFGGLPLPPPLRDSSSSKLAYSAGRVAGDTRSGAGRASSRSASAGTSGFSGPSRRAKSS
jgi:hypothetical protein